MDANVSAGAIHDGPLVRLFNRTNLPAGHHVPRQWISRAPCPACRSCWHVPCDTSRTAHQDHERRTEMGAVIPVDFRLKKRTPHDRPMPFLATDLAAPLSASQVIWVYAPLLALWGLCLLPSAERART